MTDRESIRQEIKRLKTLVNSNESYGCGFNDALLMIDGFIDNLQDEHKNKMKEVLQTEYEKGRFDMREEMVKNAVDGKVLYQIGSAEIAPTDIRYKVVSDKVYIPNAKLGDRVKILIIKP